MKNQVDYSIYKCPYSHLKKECGHELKGPEGYQDVYGVWCECGFRGPVFYIDPIDLNLDKINKQDNGPWVCDQCGFANDSTRGRCIYCQKELNETVD